MTKSSRKLLLQHLFRDRGFLPTLRLLQFLLLGSLPILSAFIFNLGWTVFFVINIALFLISLWDLFRLPRRSQLVCTRQLDEEVERGHALPVHINLTNQSERSINFRLIDSLPPSFLRVFPIKGNISGAESKTISYITTPSVRGDYKLDQLYLRYSSSLGLWEKQAVFFTVNQVRVIPDLTQAKGYLAETHHFSELYGQKTKKHRIGSGEFSQIRNYVTGDDPRKINWRQTAKLAELMTNVYEPEHGKHITILLDCGRTMGVELEKENRLERAFEAALTVAAVALQQGDYVSLMAFSNKIKTYIPAGKGLSHLRTILHHSYNIESDPAESDYAGAFHYLETVQKRQSFILLFSDLDPFLYGETPLLYVQKIRKRHKILLLGMTDPMTEKWVNAEPKDTHLAMIKSTAQREVLHRKKEIRRWGKLGLELLEVPEEHLAAEAVSHYIDIINRNVL